MFEMRPLFVVAPFGVIRTEPDGEPFMAVVEEIIKVVDGDTYLCRIADAPGHPVRWDKAVVRLEGVTPPEGAAFALRDKARAQAVKAYVERRLAGATLVTLREFRRDGSARLVADVHADRCNLSALLSGIARDDDAPEGDAYPRRGGG